MDLIGYLLPFVIILVLIGLVVFSINRVASRRTKYVNSKKVYWLLGGYVVVLTFSTALFFTIPIHPNTNFEKNMELEQNHNLELITSQDLLDEASGYMISKKEISYEKNELDLQVNSYSDQHASIQILVDKKDETDQIIEATVYQTPTYINDWNITEYMDPIQVDLSLDTLLIDGIETEFSYVSFKTEFPFTQFEANRQKWFEENVIYGQQLLLLRIPKDVELIAKEDIDIIYLDE